MLLLRSTSFAIALLLVPYAGPAQQTPVIVVEGLPVTFDQQPIERGGRVYVPLRGVFERLGASVVFDGGQINATAGAHTISLHIGSTDATVDGATQILEGPPILVGGRALVPLRFLSQALGANVTFDQKTQTIYVRNPEPVAAATSSSSPTAPAAAATPDGPSDRIAMRMLREEPATSATVDRKRPEISATFSENVDPKTLRVAIDGRDVTPETFVSERSFVYEPNFDLPAGPHGVRVSGSTPDREAFSERWTFASSASDRANYISGLEPPNGTLLTTALTVSAFTRPKAHVRTVVATSDTIANFSDVTGGSSTTDAVADAHGYFEIRIDRSERGATVVDVRITSTADDGSLAVKTLRLRQ